MKKNILKGILLIFTIMILVGCTKEKMELKNNSFTIEYGKSISNKAEDYLNNKADFLKNVKIENLPQNESDKDYPSIGDYEVILKVDDQEEVVMVSVKDTVAPEFKNLKEKYEVEYGTKIDSKQFSATDLSKTEIMVDDSKVNYKKSGTYKAIVTAKDESNNEVKKEITITVKEEKKSKNSSSSSSSNKSNSTSSNKSFSKSSDSGNTSTNGSSSSLKPGQELESKRDEDSYIEFNNGANSAWSGSGKLPSDYFE